jgi:hypothetical protein
MSPDIRDLLQGAAPAPRGRLTIDDALRRGRRSARWRRAGLSLVTLVVTAALVGLVARLPAPRTAVGQGQARGGTGTAGVNDPPPPHCRNRPPVVTMNGAYGTLVSEATTPVVEIAAGEQEGEAWSLCAYRARLTRNDQDPEETLCDEFQLGPGPHSGYSCVNLGAEAPSGADYFHRAAGGLERDAATTYFYGAISRRVERVILRVRGGDQFDATIYEPPPELAVRYKFFVGFTPPASDVMVRVEDETGAELAHELFSAP